jgi:ribose transport system permease protein
VTETVNVIDPVDDPEARAVAPRRGSSRSRRGPGVDRYAAILFFFAFYLFVYIREGSGFVSWDNVTLVLSQTAYITFVAVGVTITLIAGQFDLSVGAILGISALFVAGMTANQGLPLGVAIVFTLVLAAVVGLVNGLLVVTARVSAFIATLATGGALGGIAILYSHSTVIYTGIPEALVEFGSTKYLDLTLLFWSALAMLVITWLMTRQTVLGRNWYAIGANPEASRLAGLPVGRLVVLAFVGGGLVAGCGGILLTAQLGSAQPQTGPGLLLPAFAAAFLGGSILSDGRFTVLGAFVATYLIAFAGSGLDALGLDAGYKPLFNAVVLAAAVALTAALRRRSGATS